MQYYTVLDPSDKKTHAIKMARFSGTIFTPSSIIQGTGGATRTTGRRRESLVRQTLNSTPVRFYSFSMLFQFGHNVRYRWMKGNRAVDVHGRVYVVLCQFSKVLLCIIQERVGQLGLLAGEGESLVRHRKHIWITRPVINKTTDRR